MGRECATLQFTLRTKLGIGDFGDLAALIEQSAKQGADYVGINPLHLPYPAVPNWASPYSSSSRRWLNFLYLDIPDLPEFKRCRSVQNWFKREDIKAKLLLYVKVIASIILQFWL